ncbi:MAG: hypothetical protein KDA68_11040 [Planctomycetaceae bacterium]|nr:hypothetical protein [Planctomycetaceae bacterium]
MAKPEINAIEFCAKRSDRAVMWITFLFAMAGVAWEFIRGVLYETTNSNGVASFFESMWILLCCFTIPMIHYLCRQIHALQKRIDELEKLSTHNAG